MTDWGTGGYGATGGGADGSGIDERSRNMAAVAILVGCLLVMVAGLLVALSFDAGGNGSGGGDSQELRFKLKLIALSGTSFGFFGAGATGGAFLVGVAVLVALGLVRYGGGSSLSAGIGSGAAAIAGLLAALTVVAIIVDFTYFGDLDGDDSELLLLSLLVSDMASLVVLSVGTWLGGRTARGT